MDDAALVVAPMREADLDSVMRVERAAFGSPSARRVFVEELERPWARVDLLREGERGDVVAFVDYWIVRDEIHVLNIATLPELRRRGLASRLLDHLVAAAPGLGARFVTLEVRRGNQAALRLYRKHAFRPVGVRPGYYPEDPAADLPREDAIVMLLELPAAPR